MPQPTGLKNVAALAFGLAVATVGVVGGGLVGWLLVGEVGVLPGAACGLAVGLVARPVLRWLGWHLDKLELVLGDVRLRKLHVHRALWEHAERLERFPPDTPAYQRLAAVWDDYAALGVRNYGRFLAMAARHFRVRVRSVLDLACGTGLITRQLARRAAAVVGLDASKAMLAQAALRTREGNVRYVEGDFRDFELGEAFDAVVCGSDSLNYVTAPDELARVFRCVRRHLQPGGLFLFDVLDERRFQALANTLVVGTVRGERFENYFFYDPATRVGESRVVFADAVERHRRVPIEEGDVRRAAEEAGLEMADCFSGSNYGLYGSHNIRRFYVLRLPPA